MIRLSTQKVYAVVLAYMLSFPALLNTGNELFNMLGIRTVLDTAVMYIALVLSVAFAMFLYLRDYKKLKADSLCLYLAFIIAYILSFLMFPKNQTYLFTGLGDYTANPLYTVFIYSLPGYVFVRELKSYDCFKDIMTKLSYVVVVLSCLVYFLSPGSSATQYMVFSYNMLVPLFFVIMHKPQKRRILHYVTVSLGSFAFVFGGARGAMIFFILALVVMYVGTFKPGIKNLIVCSALAAGGIAFSFFKTGALMFVASFLESLGITSRNLVSILNSQLFNDNARLLLYRESLNNIGIMGKGIMGDRVELGIYPHSLFLELMYHFGTVLGAVLIALLCWYVGRALFRKNSAEFTYIVMLLPCGFLKLMVTGSYFGQESAFYILLGLCVNALLRSKKNEDTDNKPSLRSR